MKKTSLFAFALTSALATAAAAQPTEPATPAPQDPYIEPAPEPATPPAESTAAQKEVARIFDDSPIASPQPQPQPQVDAVAEEPAEKPVGKRLLHGFRLGYSVVMNYDKPTRDSGMSLKDEFGLDTPHMMVIGYETFYRVVGHSWLNVLLVGNVSVAGLEQSKFIPSANGLIGFEMQQSFQLGVGINLTPDPEKPAHMIMAAGWTPKVGALHTPLHFFFVPDTDKNHRAGATIGVTW